MAAFTSIAAGVALAASAAASGTSAGIAGKKRRKAERKQREILNNMRNENESDFMRDYYQNAFDDPSSKSYLKKISENTEDQIKEIQNNSVSTGTTNENVLAQKQVANEVVNDAINNVVVNNEGKKQAAKDQYIQRKDAITQGDMSVIQKSADSQIQNLTNLGNNLSNSMTSFASTYAQGGGKLLNKQTPPTLNKAGFEQMTQSSRNFANRFA